MSETAILAYCRYGDCRAEIGRKHVRKAFPVPNAKKHIAFVATCGWCNRAAQYIVPREAWRDSAPSAGESFAAGQLLEFARIELEGLESVEELRSLWASLPSPPPRDGLEGRCTCANCMSRRFVNAEGV